MHPEYFLVFHLLEPEIDTIEPKESVAVDDIIQNLNIDPLLPCIQNSPTTLKPELAVISNATVKAPEISNKQEEGQETPGLNTALKRRPQWQTDTERGQTAQRKRERCENP
jgi:hypothetical protein